MSEEKKDFIIRDKRFSAQMDQDADTQATLDSTETSEPKSEKKGADDADKTVESSLPEINFMTFIMSLNASAMVHLGVIEDPATGEKSKNLVLGKQTIDILGMLEEKTSGNLNKDEENMLKHILYDLRILYVKEKS